MSQTILLLDYEPRTVLRVTEALQPLGYEVSTAKDVDSAVNACAKVEPKIVLITSVLPRLKVEDAITQLRARAGLRATPFLVLMSGYTGQDPQADAARLGAQDIVAKPFSNDQLLGRVKSLLQRAKPEGGVSPDTRADVLEALRRSAGLSQNRGTVTSEELFGDLFQEEPEPSPAETQRIRLTPAAEIPPAPVKPTPEPKPAPVAPPVEAPPAPAAEPSKPVASLLSELAPVRQPLRPIEPDTAVERVLETTMADVRSGQAKGRPVREDTGGASVDALLSQTLSGLEVKVPTSAPRPAPRPRPVEKPPEPAQPPAPPPAKPIAAAPRPVAPPPKPAVPPPPAESVPVGTPFGQYDLIEPIATGGMAEVYKARMRGVEGFQKIVAIKRILPHLTDNDEFVTMFIDEAKLAAQLQHPNIIHIYDLGKLERSYYIAMEYIDGKDLRSILRVLEEKQSRLPLGLALFIASRLAEALDYAHRRRDMHGREMALVHRDVSPQNVLISYDGDIKLCDFGIAKAASKASHTRAGALKGKLQYMSPEQAWGKDLDHRSDIFSVGLVLYEMLTGRKAFAGDSELSILEQVRSPKIATPRDVDPAIPPEVERVVLKALRENRDERYQTAAEMASDLNGILQSLRPSPAAGELGSFLSELAGRGRASTGPAPLPARPAVAAPPPPQPAPVAPRPKPVPPPSLLAPQDLEVSDVLKPPRKIPVPLLAGVAVVAIAIVLLIWFLSREKQPSLADQTQQILNQMATPAAATPAPEGGQTPAEQPTPEAATEVRPTTAPPTPRPAAATPAPAAQQPTAAPVVAAVPTVAAAMPTAAPVEVPPTPTLPAPPTPTAAPMATRAPLAVQQPTVQEGQLVQPGPDVVEPVALENPAPAMPAMARVKRARPAGVIILSALVSHTGAVEDVTLLRGTTPDYGFDKAAIEAVRGWRFKPATKAGVRVKFRKTVTIQPAEWKP